jgi:hypothetical protein
MKPCFSNNLNAKKSVLSYVLKKRNPKSMLGKTIGLPRAKSLQTLFKPSGTKIDLLGLSVSKKVADKCCNVCYE